MECVHGSMLEVVLHSVGETLNIMNLENVRLLLANALLLRK